MTTRAHITRRAAKEGVPARTVERDYVLAHVIAGVATFGDETSLVFKGGTALRLCHFDDYCYSADLDFSLVSGSIEDGYVAISSALEATGGSIEGLRLTDDEPPRIAYVGPLGWERTLKLDLAGDELVLNTERQKLLPRWPDLPKVASVLVYTLVNVTQLNAIQFNVVVYKVRESPVLRADHLSLASVCRQNDVATAS